MLVVSQRCGGTALRTGVLEWMDVGSLGRTVKGGEEGVSLSMSMTSWSVWSSTWGWMRLTESLWVRTEGRAGTGDIVESATGHLARKTEQMNPFVDK